MDIFYFLVTSFSSEAYKDQYGFHSAYFADGSGYLTGFLLSLGIGVFLALCFYFGLCNGKSAKPATRINWWVTLLLVAVITYFVCDMVVIGAAGQPGTGFYAFCQDYANNYVSEHVGNNQTVQACLLEYNTIIDNLNQGNDVALMFNLNNVFYSVLAFVLTSFGVKNLTKHGSQIFF
ncbi:MAG: hypothetical protein BACB_04408 [Bacteroides thetaiotaomicron]|jgi:hypothetical protein